MLRSISSIFLLLALLCIFTSGASAQTDKKVLGEVTINAVDPVYSGIRALSSPEDAFSGDYATVTNVTLKKDEAIFVLQSGEIYFLKSVEGKTTGAVFIGSGEFSLTPPVEVERQHLAIFVDGPTVKESFDGLTLFFTDQTYQSIKTMPGVQMGKNGPRAEKARSAFRAKEKLLREQFRYNITSRILSDIYAPARNGFFLAFIDGQRFGKLMYGIDPLGHAEVYPEQVQLISYAESNGGIWTAFHMEDEYKNGTATSWADRRVYDIKHHKIDTIINGTRLTVTDEITLEMKEAKARFLAFDLFRTLRVQQVTDETGSALPFVQEKKDEDADFGIILPEAKPVGTQFKIKVAYDGTDALRDVGSGNFILIPRSTWYPNNPSSAFGDRASFDLTFRYPKKYVMVGVGSRVGEEKVDGDARVSSWSSDGVELAVAGFNYGDFKRKDVPDETTGLNLEVFTNKVLPDDIKNFQTQMDQMESAGTVSGTTLGTLSTSSMADTILREAQNSTRIFNAFFGKLPYKRVAMTQQPAANFGQAWPTLVFMPFTAFFSDTERVQLMGLKGGTSGFWREVAAHEVAHQWWGHSVGWTSYRDQWMSEGFAEFSSSLFIQYVKKDTNKFISYWEDQRNQIVEATPQTMGKKPYTVGPVTQGYRLNSAKTGNVARSMIYPKGAFILHMLRMLMFDHRQGTKDQRFQKMMTDFVVSNNNKDISTNDFKLAVEKHILPSMDIDKNGKMDWFFDEWVYGKEMPSYKFTYSFASGSGGKTMFNGKIEQSGVSKNFVMTVPIYLDYGKSWTYLGSVTLVGNTSIEVKDIPLPSAPKRAAAAAMQDVLAAKIENINQ